MSEQNVILLVEDDRNDAFFFDRALAGVGFTGALRHVTDIDAAKDYLFEARATGAMPVLIVADSSVSPHGSGVDFLEWQRAEGFNLPFVILTGGIDPEARERAEAAGVLRVLTKTANIKGMAEQLRETMAELPAERRSWLK